MAAVALRSMIPLRVLTLALSVSAVGQLASCDDRSDDAKTAPVTIGEKKFTLELALDYETRFKGLSKRTKVDADKGMLFVFPEAQRLEFVMRDCGIPIDIIFLDGSGRVLAQHAMKAEAPRKEKESDEAYNARLTRYSSRYPAQFAVELAGGRNKELGVKEGDLVRLDTEDLKKRAK
ncbi:MAG: DUF192 domain-containing protein [Phycisphaerae bacterium]|nr:DUF192 domain-containing protein [Phycisphaerae bacterium]